MNTELEAIWCRHQADEEWNMMPAEVAAIHKDRADLIALLDAAYARAEKAEAELARVREAAKEAMRLIREMQQAIKSGSNDFADRQSPRLARAVGEEG